MNIVSKEYMSHYKALVMLGTPIVIGQIGNIVLGFADTLMIGRYGMAELAAAGFVNTTFSLFIIFAMGFSYAITPIVGNMHGRGDDRGAGSVMKCALMANMLLAMMLLVPLGCLLAFIDRLGQPAELLPLMRPYLLVNIVSLPFVCWLNTFKQFFDGTGHTKTPMYVLLGGNVANIAGNWALIYGHLGLPEMGLLGAGISTMLSRMGMAVALTAVFFLNRRYRRYAQGFKAMPLRRVMFRRINAMGWPLALQMGMESAAFSLSAVLVGWIGTTALAAHQIMLTVSQLFYMIYYGMAAAVAVRISHFGGQGDYRGISISAKAGFVLILVVAALVSLPIFLLRHHIGAVFSDNAEVCLLVAQTTVMLIVYQFGDGMQCNYANALRGVGNVKPMIYISFFAFFLVSLPLSWLLGLHLGFGLMGVWAAYPVCLTMAGVLYWWCFRQTREVKV